MEASQITKLLQIQNTKYINRCQTVDSSTLIWKNMIQSSKYIKGVKTCNGEQNCNVPTNPCCADQVSINGVVQPTGTYSFGGSGRTTSLQTGSPQKFLNVLSGAAGSASQVYTSEIITLQKAGKESCGVAGTSPAPQNSYIELTCGTQYICNSVQGEWRSISGFPFNPADLNGQVNSIITDSSGNLYVGGNFSQARLADGSFITVNGLTKWDGSSWSAFVDATSGIPGVGAPFNNILVRALALIGNTLYLGGNFQSAGGDGSIQYIASLNLTTLVYSKVGGGTEAFGLVKTLIADGSTLYMGGEFTNVYQVPQPAAPLVVNGIASWNGTTWSGLGGGLSNSGGVAPNVGTPDALILAINNNKLYVGGEFYKVVQPSTAELVVYNIAVWDINTSLWSALGTGRPEIVNSITFLNNNVYAGGRNLLFSNPIAYWDGFSWTSIGTLSSSSEQVDELIVYGTDIYASGIFSSINGIPANNIAKWNGTTWTTLGAGTNGRTQFITILNNNLYAGGAFTQAGNEIGTQYIAEYLPYITQDCTQLTSNYICTNTNGPVNNQNVPVNNQSNPYLPPFDTYYAMKNPSANCKNCPDQNQKHFVKQCHTRFPNANNGENAVFSPCDNVTTLDPVTKQFQTSVSIVNGAYNQAPPTCEGCILPQ